MTTKKRARPNRQMGALKVAIAAGSLAASLLGTNLLAKEANVVQTAVSTNPIIIDVPISFSSNGNAEIVVTHPSAGQGISLDLAPIPQAVPAQEAILAQPVTSSKSSK